MNKTVKIKGSIWASFNKYSKQFEFRFSHLDIKTEFMTKNFIPISAYIIEIEMQKDIDLIAMQIKYLHNKRKLTLTNNKLALNIIDQKIQEFLAIENKS